MVADLRPSNELAFAYFSVAAVVTPPAMPSIDTVVSWLAPTTARVRTPLFVDPTEDLRPRLAVRRDHVAELPVGTEILTTPPPSPPELPDPRVPVLFIVDGVEDLDPDVFYARVHRKDDA